MSKKQAGKKVHVGIRQGFQNNEGAFPEFDIAILRRIASEWAEEYPAIQAIFLFRTRRQRNDEYLLDFIFNENHANTKKFSSWFQNPHSLRAPFSKELMNAYIDPSDIGRFEHTKWQAWARTPEERNFDDFTIKEYCCFLYPAPEVAPQNHPTAFFHTPDYRSITKNGEEFSLTPMQAAVIALLHKAYNDGAPELGQAYIFETIGSAADKPRIRDTFKSNPEARKALIAPGQGKDLVRLNI